MRNVLVAMMCTLGAAACGGENRPAQDPSAAATATTTETTSSANSARQATGTTPMGTAPTTPTTSTPATPTDGLDATRPVTDRGSASANASGTTNGTTSGAPATTGTTPPAADNPGAANGTKSADNTTINDRDRHGALTPMDQGGGNDRDITAAVRRSVVADKALSFNAKNVKIITVGGKVTLRGPVKSDDERASIEAKAKATPGVTSVDNQLEVKK